MKTVIVENTWLTRDFVDFGWGNGYVLIPKGHKLHGVHYDNIDVDVHGGLTFSDLVDEKWAEKLGVSKDYIGYWCVGFDTAHYSDTLLNWPKQRVQEETERLLNNLATNTH